MNLSQKPKVSVVLFNLGGPDQLSAVRPFLFNLFFDKAIIPVPLMIRWPLAQYISWKRAPTARDIYHKLGGGSPLLAQTRQQASALEQELRNDDFSIRCHICMRHWHPRADEVIQQVKDFAPDRVVLLPLYPQFSTTTTGSSLAEWAKLANRAGLTAPTVSVCCYPENAGWIKAVAALTGQTLDRLAEHPAPVRLLFSAHGLPESVIASGDPYQAQVEKTAAAVVQAMGRVDLDWRVCYQSRVGPKAWIQPYTEDEIRRAGAEGKALVITPIAFVSEHSETLVELDMEYRELADQAGVPAYERTPAVTAHGDFIAGLGDLVRQAVNAPAGRPMTGNCQGERCAALHCRCPRLA